MYQLPAKMITDALTTTMAEELKDDEDASTRVEQSGPT